MAARRKAIGYIRVSRVNGRGGDSFIAPEVQRETILRIAKAKGYEVVEWIEDLDESGAKYDRPGFQAALEATERGEVEAIIVARLTRFARSVLDTHRALTRLEAAGASLVAADMDVDVSTPTGKLTRNMLAALAEFELEVIREQWVAARSSAVERGVYISNVAPLGYRFVADDDHRLEPGDDAEAVVELFVRRAAGDSWVDLADGYLAATGRRIHPGSIRKVIANRAYLGELRCGELVNPDAHTPLVTLAQWSAAQRPKAQRPARNGDSVALLGAATLRCGTCGRTMSYRGGKGAQYTCNRRGDGEVCSAPVLIDGAKLDAYVEEAFLARLAALELEGTPRDAAELEAAQAALAAAEGELAQYLAADLVSVVGVEAFRSGAEGRQAEVDARRAELDELMGDAHLDARLASVGDEWPELELDERRRLVASAFEAITVHRADRSRGRWQPIAERVELRFVGDSVATLGADHAVA